jgi:hypothetical protein
MSEEALKDIDGGLEERIKVLTHNQVGQRTLAIETNLATMVNACETSPQNMTT